MKKDAPAIAGFIGSPKRHAAGGIFHGRFVCHDVQWTGDAPDSLVTFTITAEELAAAAENHLVWTDQDVQRGIQPGASPQPARELAVADGYPDAKLYIFDAKKSDDIAEKLLRGERVFLNSLVWNLRPGTFEAFADSTEREIYIYSGRIYLPDSHHRHQAIIKTLKAWRETPSSYPKFSGDQQFKVELYFLSKQDEGNYFFDKNQLPKPTALSKAYDLTTLDDLSTLAKKVIEKSSSLRDNVNRVTDRLTAKNPQVITLSTLREMMRTFAGGDTVDDTEMAGLATVAATFYDLMTTVRPELGHLIAQDRRHTRSTALVDAAVMMHGYAALMRDFNDDLGKLGNQRATSTWNKKLQRLSPSRVYTFEKWSGDLFEKRNPLWQRAGVVKPGRDGQKLTVLNTGAARGECARVLRQILSLDSTPKSLKFAAQR